MQHARQAIIPSYPKRPGRVRLSSFPSPRTRRRRRDRDEPHRHRPIGAACDHCDPLARLAIDASPTCDEDVKAARRTLARGRNAPELKAPLHWSDVEKALSRLGDDLRDLRSKALIAVALLHARATRRAHCAAAGSPLARDEGDGSVTLKAKGGDQKERYLAPQARRALETWLTKAGIKEGTVFRRLESHGRRRSDPNLGRGSPNIQAHCRTTRPRPDAPGVADQCALDADRSGAEPQVRRSRPTRHHRHRRLEAARKRATDPKIPPRSNRRYRPPVSPHS